MPNRRRNRPLSLAAFALAFGMLTGSLPGFAQVADVTPTDHESPYVMVLYPQLPNVQRPWEGGITGNRNLLGRTREAGLHWTYIWIAWSDIELQEGVYDEVRLAKLDEYVAAAREYGVHVVVQLMIGAWSNPQPWAGQSRLNSQKVGANQPPGEEPDTSGPGTPTPVDMSKTTNWVTLLVDRYRPHGALAQELGWNDDYGVTTWELENEPDSLVWYGDWSKIPKDYAEYVSLISPTIHAADPKALVKAPALSHRDGERLSGIPWLTEVLSAGDATSEWASDTYRANGGMPGPGPLIDAISFHRNNPTLHDKQTAQRALELMALADEFRDDPVAPIRPDVQFHYSEGGALQYTADVLEFSWAQTQVIAQLHGVGVDKMNFSPAAEINKDPWADQPIFKSMQAFAEFLPRARETVPADDEILTEGVTAYKRTDPASGAITWLVWADTLEPDAASGEPFTAFIPVSTSQALVINADWSRETVDTTDGRVEVVLTPADPSPTIWVVELPDEAKPAVAPDTGMVDTGVSDTATTLPATGGGLGAAGALMLLAGIRRRRNQGHAA
jgi:hypothetical protein